MDRSGVPNTSVELRISGLEASSSFAPPERVSALYPGLKHYTDQGETNRTGSRYSGTVRENRPMTAWLERPEPERPPWQPRDEHTYQPGDPFAFDARNVGQWTGVVLEVAPNQWLRIRIDTAPAPWTYRVAMRGSGRHDRRRRSCCWIEEQRRQSGTTPPDEGEHA